MMDVNEEIVVQNIIQEMKGLEQISRILSISRDMSESDVDDVWYVMQVMIRNWRELLTGILN